MKRIFTLFSVFLMVISTLNAQLVIKKDNLFRTADQMLLANELFLSGEPFAESLGYNLDDLDPMVPNSPDSIAYATGIEGYEYSRYLLGSVISRSGIGLNMMWSPMIGQMAAMEPEGFDGSFTGGMVNGFKEDDEMMMMVGHFSMLANQMAPMNPFPQFADFESGNPQLPQTVAPDFAMDFASLRWDRSQFSKVLNPAAMGQSLWKQYYWAKDMLGAFHDGDDNGIEADGIISPDSVGSPNFDPNNNVFYGGNNLDGFIGQVLTAESINKVAFILNNLAYDGSSLGMVDPATYDPANGIKYFPHRVAVTESAVNEMLPPKLSGLEVIDAGSQLFDQISLLLGTIHFKNMMDPTINDPEHYAYHAVFDGNPFPAPMSQTGMMGAYDIMAGASMVLVKNLLAMHYNETAGTFVDVSGLAEGAVSKGNTISSVNAGYVLLALKNVAEEFAGTPLATMATDALNAQASFIYSSLKDTEGGFYNGYDITTGADQSAKKAESQAAISRGLYAAYELTNNSAYLDAANEAYQFLISRFYVPSEQIFRTEEGNNTASYNPFNLAVLSGGLREASLVGGQTDAAAIYTRFFNKVYSPMLLAEAELTGETGNDSDGDGIPYVAGGTVATVFAAEAEYSFTITGISDRLQQQAGLNIYPNPVSNQATISFNDKDFTNTSVSIVNIAGQTVQHFNTNKNRNINWNVQGINNGIYFVRLESNGKPVSVKKVVVNK
ncbi:T9SS type A sorting domain-containing protein [Prolixibacter sp. NT017]|uniref:T9SS type A sorting domain-containing protein n=1 Tax=Prolixibacter sp. NT017 TaxID=2652390 RepID=UPI00129906ED|nr:T9SS type A sorting domain-containing protein [Prolixibacter sp. NT017]